MYMSGRRMSNCKWASISAASTWLARRVYCDNSRLLFVDVDELILSYETYALVPKGVCDGQTKTPDHVDVDRSVQIP